MKNTIANRKIDAGIISYPITILLSDRVGLMASIQATQKQYFARWVFANSRTKYNDDTAYKIDCNTAMITKVLDRLTDPNTYINSG